MVVQKIALELESLTYALLSNFSAKAVCLSNLFPILQNNLGGQVLIQELDRFIFELSTCAKDAAALYVALFVVRPILELLLGDTDGISRLRPDLSRLLDMSILASHARRKQRSSGPNYEGGECLVPKVCSVPCPARPNK